jgi:hypothetical protein
MMTAGFSGLLSAHCLGCDIRRFPAALYDAARRCLQLLPTAMRLCIIFSNYAYHKQGQDCRDPGPSAIQVSRGLSNAWPFKNEYNWSVME